MREAGHPALGGADRVERAGPRPAAGFQLDQQLLFRLQPVLTLVPVLATPLLIELEGPPGDQLVELSIIQKQRLSARLVFRQL